MLPRAIAGPIRVSVDTSKIVNLPLSTLIKLLDIFFLRIYCLGRKGQIVGRFGLTDCGDIGASCTLCSILVLRIYGLTGLSAGATEVRRLCCNGL